MMDEESSKENQDSLSNIELLKEYELCQNAAQGLESTIWRLSAALGVGSLGTFILIANHPKEEQPPWQVACVIGLIILFASLTWFLMARRWWSVQHAIYMRMRDIEEDMNIVGRVSYLHYLDNPTEKHNLLTKQKNRIETRLGDRWFFVFPGHQMEGVQNVVWLLPVIMLIAWGIYIGWLIFFNNS